MVGFCCSQEDGRSCRCSILFAAGVPRMRLSSSLFVVQHLFCRLVCFFSTRSWFFSGHVSFAALWEGSNVKPRVLACVWVSVWVSGCPGVWAFGCVGVWCRFSVGTCLSLTVSTTRGTVPLTLVTARHDRIPFAAVWPLFGMESSPSGRIPHGGRPTSSRSSRFVCCQTGACTPHDPLNQRGSAM